MKSKRIGFSMKVTSLALGAALAVVAVGSQLSAQASPPTNIPPTEQVHLRPVGSMCDPGCATACC
jgi:hypothetical protein